MRFPMLTLVPARLLPFGAFGVAGQPDQSRYFPVHKGDRWLYDGVLSSPERGSIKSPFSRVMGDKEVFHGKIYNRCRETVLAGLSTELQRRDAAGFYFLEDGGTEEQTYALLPPTPGRKWMVQRKKGTSTFTVIGLEAITLGEKVYTDCIHLREMRENEYTGDYWEAPDIGCVKMDMQMADGTRFVFTLREFTKGSEE